MPEAAETETLADRARQRLKLEGFDDRAIDLLAERYVDRHGADDVEDFVDWALAHREAAAHPDDPERTGEQSFPASDPPSTWAGAPPGSG